jgi:glutaredoxin 3
MIIDQLFTRPVFEDASMASPEQLAYNRLRAQYDSYQTMTGGGGNTAVSRDPVHAAKLATVPAELARMAAALKAKGIDEIEKIRIDLDPEQRALMMEKTGRRTVPQIYIGDTHVGGFDDLSALDREGKLDPLLQA